MSIRLSYEYQNVKTLLSKKQKYAKIQQEKQQVNQKLLQKNSNFQKKNFKKTF